MAEAAQQRLIVVVGASEWAAARRAADAYRAVLKSREDLIQLNDGVMDQTFSDGLAQFQRHRVVLLTARDEAAFGGGQAVAWQDDPFGLFSGWVQARAQETPVRPRDGRLYVGDGRLEYVVLP